MDESRVYRENADTLFKQDLEKVTGNQSLILNRLLAVPVVAIDVVLEGVCPLFRSIESALFIFVSLGLTFFHLVKPGTEKQTQLETDLRAVLINLNNTVEHFVFAVVKIVTVPLNAIAQLFLTFCYPLSSQRSSLNFPILYEQYFEAYQVPPDLAAPYENDEDSGFMLGIYRRLYNGGLSKRSVIPVTVVDAAMEVLVATGKAIVFPFLTTMFLARSTISFVGCLVSGNDTVPACRNFKVGFAILNTALQQLAHAISRAVMTPITLIAQLATAFSDLEKVQPIHKQVYRPHVGDQLLTMYGIEAC